MHTLEKSGDSTIIHFTGDLTIAQASEARTTVAAALSESSSVVLDVGKIEDADLSFFQIVCSAHRTALKAHKSLDLSGAFPESIKQTLRVTGFCQKSSLCGLEAFKNCLWSRI